MNRRARRRAGLRGPSGIPQRSARPVSEFPDRLVWWQDRDWATAHASSLCPRFIREWAGRGARPLQGNIKRAARDTIGGCPICAHHVGRLRATGQARPDRKFKRAIRQFMAAQEEAASE